MITDFLTLNLIAIYLSKFESNQGDVNRIHVSIRSQESNVTKTIEFSSIENLKGFAQLANVDFSKIDCSDLKIYELKGFNTTIDLGGSTSNKNIVENIGNKFVKDSENINSANMDILNKLYIPAFLDIYNKWLNLQLNEYIIQQRKYIDCGYIQVYFEEDLLMLKNLYKKYKNI